MVLDGGLGAKPSTRLLCYNFSELRSRAENCSYRVGLLNRIIITSCNRSNNIHRLVFGLIKNPFRGYYLILACLVRNVRLYLLYSKFFFFSSKYLVLPIPNSIHGLPNDGLPPPLDFLPPIAPFRL